MVSFGELKESNKKVKNNILPPFSDNRWRPTSSKAVRDVHKNGYEIGFVTPKYQGFECIIDARDIAGKSISMSVERKSHNTSIAIFTTINGEHRAYSMKSNMLEGYNIPKDATSVRVKIQNDSSEERYIYFKNIQVEVGSSTTKFEGYYEINDNAVDKQEVVSKNLFNIHGDINTTVKNLSSSYDNFVENGVLTTYNGNSSTNSRGQRFNLSVGKTYTVSCYSHITSDGTSSRMRVKSFDSIFNGGDVHFNSESMERKSITFTPPTSDIVVDFVRIGGSSKSSPAQFYDIQLEESSIETEYEHYREQVNRKTEEGSLIFDSTFQDFARTGRIPSTEKYTLAVQFAISKKPTGREDILWGHNTNRNILNISSDMKLGWYTQIGGVNRGYYYYGIVKTGVKHTAVFRYDGSRVELFLDGIKLYEYEATGTSNKSAFNLGVAYNRTYNFFNGNMYFFKYFNRPLSNEEIYGVGDIDDYSLLASYDFRKPQDRDVMIDFSDNGLSGDFFGAKSTIKAPHRLVKSPYKKYPFKFSRQSIEILDGVQYGLNQPRIINNGILVEEEIENLAGSLLDWAGTGSTVSNIRANEYNVVLSHTTYTPYLMKDISGLSATAYTLRFFVKPKTHSSIRCGFRGSLGSGADETFYNLKMNEWNEIVYTRTLVDGAMSPIIYTNGTRDSEFDLKLVQIEKGSRPSNFAKNIIRPMDKLNIPVTLDGQGGSIEFEFEGDTGVDIQRRYLFDSNGGRWIIWKSESSSSHELYTNGRARFKFPSSSFSLGRNKVRLIWSATTSEVWVNDVKVGNGIHDGKSSATDIYLGRRNIDESFYNAVFYSFIVKDRNGLITFKM